MYADFDSEFYNLVNIHYHVLIDTTTFANDTMKLNQRFPVPCIYKIFKLLFWTALILETSGDVFPKIKLAMEFNFNSSVEKHH